MTRTHVPGRRTNARRACARAGAPAGRGRVPDLGDRLEDAWRREVKVFGLEVADREAILRVLEEDPRSPPSCAACSSRSTSGARAKGSPDFDSVRSAQPEAPDAYLE